MFASSEAESLASSEALSITSFEVDASAFSEALTERHGLLSSRFALLEIESGLVDLRFLSTSSRSIEFEEVRFSCIAFRTDRRLLEILPSSCSLAGFIETFCSVSLGSLSTRDFETRTASGSALFSLISRLRTITFTLLSTFSPLGMISIKMWETPLSWHAKCSLPVAVRVSKTRVLKLPVVRGGYIFLNENGGKKL